LPQAKEKKLKSKSLILRTAAVGVGGWAVSFLSDLVLQLVHASAFLAYYLDDVLVGIAAAFAYWFFSQYKLQIIDRRQTIAYLDDTIRNALQLVLLSPDENLIAEVAAAAERINRALMAVRLQTQARK
jgi:hypothetical protein